MSDSFRQKLALTVIDKLLIGVVILGVATLASYYLEQYKSREYLKQEIAKVRVEKIGAVWTQLYELERLYEVRFMASQDEERPGQTDWMDQWNKLRQGVPDKLRAAKEAVNVNRFWLGEEVYTTCNKFFDEVSTARVVDDGEETLKKLSELRLDIQQILEIL